MLLQLESLTFVGENKVVYSLRVIEYQHRGLPHAHVVVQFTGLASSTNADRLKWADGYTEKTYYDSNKRQPKKLKEEKQYLANIEAYLPPHTDNPTTYLERENNAVRVLMKKHMIHHCSVGNVNQCKKEKDSLCSKGYDEKKVRSKTMLNKKGFPEYLRCQECDLKVVPTNRRMLLDWDSHLNVELCSGPKSVLYLYSYLYKGAKKVRLLYVFILYF
jgi:hypothetical protein